MRAENKPANTLAKTKPEAANKGRFTKSMTLVSTTLALGSADGATCPLLAHLQPTGLASRR